MTSEQAPIQVKAGDKLAVVHHWVVAAKPTLTRTAIRVLTALVYRRNWRNGQCNPSQARLAEDLSVSSTSITNAISELIERGAITVKSGGKGVSNSYAIDFSAGGALRAFNDRHTKPPCQEGQPHLVELTNRAGNKQDKENKKKKGRADHSSSSSLAGAGTISTVTISANESGPIEAWSRWISQNLGGVASDVIEATKQGGGYQLPRRYPEDNAEAAATYRQYFAGALRGQGQ